MDIAVDQPPRASVEVSETNIALGELMWFPDPRGAGNLIPLERRRTEISIDDVNPAVEGATIVFNASTPYIAPR